MPRCDADTATAAAAAAVLLLVPQHPSITTTMTMISTTGRIDGVEEVQAEDEEEGLRRMMAMTITMQLLLRRLGVGMMI